MKKKTKTSENKNIKTMIEIPGEYLNYLRFLEITLDIDKKEYLEHIVKEEIKSRLFDLKALAERC